MVITHRVAPRRPATPSNALAGPLDSPSRGSLIDGTWLLAGPARNSRCRVIAALGALGEAAGHIPVMAEHLTEAPYIGVGFVLLTVAGFVLAQLLLTADTRAVWVATATVAALALFGFVLSRTIGLPQIEDDIGNWSEPLGIVCIAAEALMLAAAVRTLTMRSNADQY